MSGSLLIAAGTPGLPAQQARPSQLDRYSDQAQKAMAAKDWGTAAKVLETLVQLAPNVPEVQANLGIAYYSQNRIFDAASAFERALKLDPKMTRAATLLGLCYAEMGRNGKAVALLEPAFRKPADRETGRLAGLSLQRAYAAMGLHSQAAVVSEELLKRFPGDPEILFNASRLHAERSYELISQLMHSSPNSVWVHYATAQVHESLQHFDLAIAEYKAILEMEPRLPGVHFRLGRALLQNSKEPSSLDSATHEFEQELTLSPQNSDAEYEIGEIRRQQGQFEAALEHFSKAVRYHPDFTQARIGLARTLLHLGRPEEARGVLVEAARTDPQNEILHFLLASAYRALGDISGYQKEMALFQKLQAAGSRSDLSVPGAPASSGVTRQDLDR